MTMRGTANSSSHQDEPGNSDCSFEVSKEILIFVNVLALLVALVGNSFLVAALTKMKEPLMLLIANMAASDLLTAIFLLPRFIKFAVTDSLSWPVQGLGGTILCKMCTFLSDTSISVSSQSLVIIAVERFLAFLYPFKALLITGTTRRLLIASTWMVAMAIHAPYFIAFDLVKSQNITICQNKWEINNKSAFRGYNIFLYLTVLLVPLVVISILYPIVVCNLWKDKMALHRSPKGVKCRRQCNKNLFKLAAATILSFIICWQPFAVTTLLKFFDVHPKCSQVFNVIFEISYWLARSYCAVNPIICFVFLRNFRAELRIMCRLWRNHVPAKTRTSTGIAECKTELLQRSSHSHLSPQTTSL